MGRIRLNPFTVVVIVLVIIVVLSFFGKYFNSVNSRITELERQISEDLQLLKLTQERQEELAKKALQAYRILVSVIFFAFVSLIGLSVLVGVSYQDALEIHLGTTGILVTMITVVFYNTWNPDVLLKILRKKIRIWIYQRNGINSSTIEKLEIRLRNNRLELNKLRVSKTS